MNLPNDLIAKTISVLTDVGMILNVCKSEWQDAGSWSEWDEQVLARKTALMQQLYELQKEFTDAVPVPPNSAG